MPCFNAPHRLLIRLLATLVLFLAATPGVAQAQGGGDEATSFFQAFFLADDWLGLIIIWVLIVASVVTVALTILFVSRYRKKTMMPEETRCELEALLAEKKYREALAYAREDGSFLGRVTSAALDEAGNGYGAMERAIEETGDAETTRLLRPIEILNVLGNIAPMMGLFGTVYGMILAFQQLVAAGGNADPQQLAAGISTALVTTFWGLVVAIPAMAAYALVRNNIDALSSESLLVAENLIQPFKPSQSRRKRPAPPKPDPEG